MSRELGEGPLERMRAVLSGNVGRGEVPGLVALVSKGEEAHLVEIGGLGTTAYTDPARGAIGILLTERLMESPQPLPRVQGLPEAGLRGYRLGSARPSKTLNIGRRRAFQEGDV